MNIYIFAIIGLIIGAILGWIAPLHIPASYSNYTSVAVLAALDAVLVAVEQHWKEHLILVTLSLGSFQIWY